MCINIAIHKAFICHDLVNKLFIAKTFVSRKNINMFNALIFVKAYENKNKFVQIKSKAYSL